MPAQAINLLPQKDFDHTLTGKFLRWALTYGRYIIISTEIIVLLAFIYRFSLDMKITDLNEEIEQKSAIVIANQAFEERFRNLQNRVNSISSLMHEQNTMNQVLASIEQITPTEVRLSSLTVKDTKVSLTAVSTTSQGLAAFLKNLQNVPILTNINVTNAAKQTSTEVETTVTIEALVKNGTAFTQLN